MAQGSTRISIQTETTWDNPVGDAVYAYDVDGNIETKTVGATVLSYFYTIDGDIDYITDGTNIKTFNYDIDGNVDNIVYT